MYAGEIVLAETHLVRFNEWILVDGNPHKAKDYGTVSYIKKSLSKLLKRDIHEIRWCNSIARELR